MSRIIEIITNEDTEARLKAISKELSRSEDQLCECAVSEAALDYFRGRKDDPADEGKNDG